MIRLIDKGFSSKKTAPKNKKPLEAFLKCRAFQDYPFPALVDTEKALALLSPDANEEECEKVLMLSRFSFMGTDGMRGKVFAEDTNGLDSLRLFTEENILSGKIISLAVKAFVRMLERNGITKAGDSFCTGNDGRDAAFLWKLSSCMNESFLDCGMKVDDIGVTPTPYVPLYMLEKALRGGAMLTASHNPSNQNGIKFFLDGKKLLNEGPLGAYALSAYMYELAMEEEVNRGHSSTGPDLTGKLRKIDYSERRKSFLNDFLPSNFASELSKSTLFIDAANGAWTETVSSFFKENGLPFILTSAAPTGFNINAGCGVAELEGHDSYTKDVIPYSPDIVKAVYKKGSASQGNAGAPVFGIALDGDGDRGFVLGYEQETDSVKVYDGDEEAFLIATIMKAAEMSPQTATPSKKAVCTVESDVMAPVWMKEKLGLECDLVDVGDKWICNYPEDKLSIGFESSGHVIIPCQVQTPSGKKLLLTGNGMFTALTTILALLKGEKSFERGFSKTYYTYYVNKNLFYPDSLIWNKDIEIMEEGLKELGKERKKLPGLEVKRRIFKDPDLLAYSLYQGGMQIALLFSRNSGTEDKNAVYLKCRPDLKSMLLPIARSVCENHRKSMRNKNSPEAKYMEKAKKLFAEKGSFEAKELTQDLPLATAVLHALEREGKVLKEKNRYRAIESF
ncbi:MAG: hypothetical protein K5930_07565 [Treponemataceae bacterium]|nr:hypothetical protein [Treponemataceae bacterium]